MKRRPLQLVSDPYLVHWILVFKGFRLIFLGSMLNHQKQPYEQAVAFVLTNFLLLSARSEPVKKWPGVG